MRPLGIDLITRVIQAVDGGMGKTQAAKTFKVSRRVVYNWLERRKKTGRLAPKEGYQKGHGHKVPDLEIFEAFAERHKSFKSKDMAKSWEKETGVVISKTVILKHLKKIKFTSKKNVRVS
jgi:transposase